MRPFSSVVLDGLSRAPSRAMLYPVGYKESDFSKPQVGVASTWSMVTPCNMHIDQLAREAALGIDKAGGKATIFNTITISDGISMGTEGMKYSLVSREVIADSIETVVGCQGFDGFIAIGGCDKNMPGCVMAMTRMNRASVFVYGGTIMPGCLAKRAEAEADADRARPMRRGLAFGLSNPKAYPVSVAMFGALLSGYGDALDWGDFPALLAAACAGFVSADIALVACVGAGPMRRLYARHATLATRAAGVLFLGFAAQALYAPVAGLLGR